MTDEIILKEATLSPRVRTYIFFVVLSFLIGSIIGILLVPFWLLGLGQYMSGLYFKTLSCQITNKNLKFSKKIRMMQHKNCLPPILILKNQLLLVLQ